MGGIDTQIWNVLGILLLVVSGYFVITRTLMPQFALPWFGRKRRQRAVERIEILLDDPGIDDDCRFDLKRYRNTLLAYDAPHREAWAAPLPVSEIVKEIDELWETRNANQT